MQCLTAYKALLGNYIIWFLQRWRVAEIFLLNLQVKKLRLKEMYWLSPKSLNFQRSKVGKWMNSSSLSYVFQIQHMPLSHMMRWSRAGFLGVLPIFRNDTWFILLVGNYPSTCSLRSSLWFWSLLHGKHSWKTIALPCEYRFASDFFHALYNLRTLLWSWNTESIFCYHLPSIVSVTHHKRNFSFFFHYKSCAF